MENRTYIYNFEELRLIDAIETCPNSRGLVALNPDPENTVLASPDVQKGYVRLNVYEKNKSFKVPAHQAALSALCQIAECMTGGDGAVHAAPSVLRLTLMAERQVHIDGLDHQFPSVPHSG